MGHPIGHSRSPAIHRQFAEQLGLEIEYTAIDVEPGHFPESVADFRQSGGHGLNVTVPFKLDAFNLATHRSERAELAGAVNTLMFEEGDAVFGDNTDGIGFIRDVTANLGQTITDKQVLIVGAGGAVRGILGPILEAGPKSLVIANRTVGKAEVLAELFRDLGDVNACGLDGIDGSFDLVVNGTAASLEGQAPILPETVFAPGAVAYDLMYASKPTAFLQWAASLGVKQVTDGLGMLVEQAAESFYIWLDRRPETASVITALRHS